jgi:N-acyl-phosphatidylethanolamine-hydrolysing phospholipase D
MVITGDASAAKQGATQPPPLLSEEWFQISTVIPPMLGRVALFTRIGQWQEPRGKPRPTHDGVALRTNGIEATATWVGHSTFLVQLDGVNILTDPHWSERASPLRFAGPRRMIAPGLRFEDLPPIQAVVISHDTTPPFDEETEGSLATTTTRFVVPLGLRVLAISDHAVIELTVNLSGGWPHLVCTPAQHSSGRTLTDQNRRLWASPSWESKRFSSPAILATSPN